MIHSNLCWSILIIPQFMLSYCDLFSFPLSFIIFNLYNFSLWSSLRSFPKIHVEILLFMWPSSQLISRQWSDLLNRGLAKLRWLSLWQLPPSVYPSIFGWISVIRSKSASSSIERRFAETSMIKKITWIVMGENDVTVRWFRSNSIFIARDRQILFRVIKQK